MPVILGSVAKQEVKLVYIKLKGMLNIMTEFNEKNKVAIALNIAKVGKR